MCLNVSFSAFGMPRLDLAALWCGGSMAKVIIHTCMRFSTALIPAFAFEYLRCVGFVVGEEMWMGTWERVGLLGDLFR